MLFIAKLWKYKCILKDNETTAYTPNRIYEQPPLEDCDLELE